MTLAWKQASSKSFKTIEIWLNYKMSMNPILHGHPGHNGPTGVPSPPDLGAATFDDFPPSAYTDPTLFHFSHPAYSNQIHGGKKIGFLSRIQGAKICCTNLPLWNECCRMECICIFSAFRYRFTLTLQMCHKLLVIKGNLN